MKPGIVVLLPLSGPVAERLHDVQRRYDPRMAAELPPHVTIVGSSGMGPIAPATTVDELRARLEPIALETPPLVLRFAPPMRFMQTDIVVLPLDPHGPVRVLHERILTSGLPFEAPRFAFTPHCTLSFYPELDARRRRELLSLRLDEPITVDRLQCYRTVSVTRTEMVLELPLGSSSG